MSCRIMCTRDAALLPQEEWQYVWVLFGGQSNHAIQRFKNKVSLAPLPRRSHNASPREKGRGVRVLSKLFCDSFGSCGHGYLRAGKIGNRAPFSHFEGNYETAQAYQLKAMYQLQKRYCYRPRTATILPMFIFRTHMLIQQLRTRWVTRRFNDS